ncbi:MAG: adenylyltransferase/cytidyltransferase family protein, partial [Candidatus Omnitrophica bacterium]|nr:adenylyltransferase/cytidyltransferase family protein [Candidatus Omnitrophota bacterium]
MPRVLTGFRAVIRPPRRPVVTIGVFDGVHLAHQRLIRTTLQLARRLRGTGAVITFDPDPQTVLDPGSPHPTLMPLEARVERLR